MYTVWPDMGSLRKDSIFPERIYKFAVLDNFATIKLVSGKWYISTTHPYDLQDYHWAYSEDGKHWHIYHARNWKKAIITLDAHAVVSEMRTLDKAITPHIDRT